LKSRPNSSDTNEFVRNRPMKNGYTQQFINENCQKKNLSIEENKRVSITILGERPLLLYQTDLRKQIGSIFKTKRTK